MTVSRFCRANSNNVLSSTNCVCHAHFAALRVSSYPTDKHLYSDMSHRTVPNHLALFEQSELGRAILNRVTLF